MANIIRIGYGTISPNEENTDKKTNQPLVTKVEKYISVPLTDPIALEIKSDMGSFSDLVPEIASIVGIAKMYLSSGGTINKGLLDLDNMFNVPRWKGTAPPMFTAKLIFHTVDKPYEDVFEPITDLVKMTVVTKESDNSFRVPGLGLQNLLQATSKGTTDDNALHKSLKNGGKFISVEVPGIIYLPIAIILSAQPVFSEEITESGYPLWGTVELQISGLYPASNDIFDAAVRQVKSRKVSQALGKLKK